MVGECSGRIWYTVWMQMLSYSSYLYNIRDSSLYKKQPNPLALTLASVDPKMSSSLSSWYQIKVFNQCPRNWGVLRASAALANTALPSRDPLTLQSIETVNVDGAGRHTFPKVFLEGEDPVGLAVFENSFFWTNKLQLFHASPHNPQERVVLLNASISAFSVLHKSQQPKSKLLLAFKMLVNQNAYWTETP